MSKRIHIMYADDDVDDAYLFEEALKNIGISCRLTVFPNGLELIDQLQQSAVYPDMIFMDINMPLRNGLDCLRDIRRNEQWHSIPVLIFSTSDAEIYQRKAIASGAYAYVHKPSTFNICLQETFW